MKDTIIAVIISLVAVTSAVSFAAESPPHIHLACVTEFPTTTYVMDTHGDQVHVMIYHHHGTEFMPIVPNNLLVTPHDLPDLNSIAENLSKLGPRLDLYWPLSKCTSHSATRFECFNGNKGTVNGVGIEPYAIYTGTSTVDSLAGITKYVKVDVDLAIEGHKSVAFGMRYQDSECRTDFASLPAPVRKLL